MALDGSARLLVVEDNAALRRGLVRALREGVRDVDDVGDGARALELLRGGTEPYHVVVTDLRLPGSDGLEVLRAARERDQRTSVILLTAHATVEVAVEAMKLGAFDFVQKPVDLEQLEVRVARAVEHARLLSEVTALRAERAAENRPPRIVGSSASLRAAIRMAERVAPSRSTVLLTGETGTGKEVLARLIPALSPRAVRPFVAMNCAAIPETLLEAELFGHERGAFTGADRQRAGRFEQAHGGSLFLDEIGDMSPATQAKLLRVLQDGEFRRLGGTRALRSDVRVVAATNRDLQQAIRDGAFREDLYFRINVVGIRLPPLRERPEDAVALAHHFVEVFGRELGRPREGFTDDALARIRAHRWPGNVRELRNAIERAVIVSDGVRIRGADVAIGRGDVVWPGLSWRPDLPPDGLPLEEAERALVLEALGRTGFVQKDAARLLRISRRKLNYMIRRMGITHPSWRRNRDSSADVASSRSAERVCVDGGAGRRVPEPDRAR